MSLRDYWYVLCRSEALTQRPRASQLFGDPVVSFRGSDGKARTLLDRCAHRNVPLSLGQVREATLECRYHGWRFDGSGACSFVPGRCSAAPPRASVPYFATREQDGFVWAWARPNAAPSGEPYALDALAPGYTVIQLCTDYPAGLHASLENTIDVPHTVFVHRGLFRSASSAQRVACTVSRRGGEVSVAYQGENRPETWFARLLAPQGGALEHEDRFVLPSIIRVEYRLGARAHLLSTALFTPLDERHTRLHVRIALRLGTSAGRLLSPLLRRVATRVLSEDRELLAQQTSNIERFGAPSFASTELDSFSLQVERLLAQAEQGSVDDESSAHRYEFMT